MRQGDGADLPGANTPPNAETSILYVSSDDTRQSVLEAILAQDKRGRQRIALVLPTRTRNTALSRPADFDGLKGMRGDLYAELVIIAPPGSPPAELARQRRFSVYPDLEAFARSLQDAEPTPEVSGDRTAFEPPLEKREPDAALPTSPTPSPPAQAPAADQEPQTVQAPLPDTGEEDERVRAFPLAPAPTEVQESVQPVSDPEPAPAEPTVPHPAERDDERIILIPSQPRVPPAVRHPVPISAATPARAVAVLPAKGGRRRRRWWITLPIVLLVLLVGFLVYQPLLNLIVVPKATITITPASTVLRKTSTITAVIGKPDAAHSQVQARVLFAASATLQKTVTASGVAHTPATQATGLVTFYNPSPVPRTVPAGTVLLGASGVPVVTDVDVTVPTSVLPTTGQITAPARAVNAGATGNIPANDLDVVACCGSPALLVSNTNAFTGGVDAQTSRYVEQGDIDATAAALATSLTPQTQADVVKQVQAGEELAASPGCVPLVSSDLAAGDRADAVTVSASVTCTGEVFDQRGASALAESLLLADPALHQDAAYAPVGHMVTTIQQATTNTQSVITLNILAEGVWVYQFNTTQVSALRRLVVGRNQQNAQALLLKQRGVSHTSIQLSGGNGSTLPSDPTQIALYVLSVPGM